MLGRIGDLGVEPVAGVADGGENEPADPVRVIQRQLQGHPAAKAEAEHVGLADAEVVQQRGHVTGQVAQVDVPVDVGGAPVSLQLGGDHLAVGGQLGPDVAERQVDGHQPAVQQHERPARPRAPRSTSAVR